MKTVVKKNCLVCDKEIPKHRKFCSFSCRSICTNRKIKLSKVLDQLRSLSLNDTLLPSEIKTIAIQLKCGNCEELKSLTEFHNNKANTGRYYKSSFCKDCANRYPRDGSVESYILRLIQCCKSTANHRARRGRTECGITTLTKDDILSLKEKQKGRCAISGVKLKWKCKSGWKKASVDRIDNNKGYTLDNVRFVAWGINQALSDNDYEDFIKMCHRVADNNPRVYEKKENPEIIAPKESPQPQKTVQKRKPRPHKRTYPNGKKCMDCENIISKSAKRCVNCVHKFQRKVKDRPSKKALQELLKTHSYCSLGRKYNVSDNAIRKWLK